jgi:hypothetical protein
MAHCQDDITDTCSAHLVNHYFHDGFVANGEHWFWKNPGIRSQARAFTAGKNDCFHKVTSISGFLGFPMEELRFWVVSVLRTLTTQNLVIQHGNSQ